MPWHRPDPGTQAVLDVLRDHVAGRPVAMPTGRTWVDAAETHGVLPVVAAVLERAGHGAALPADADAELTRARAHQLRVLADLSRVARTLDGAGIPWLVLKGPALAWLVYDPQLARPSSDLDVLVPPAAFEDAVRLLASGGAVERAEDWAAKLRARHGEVGLDLRGGLHLDLHWDAVSLGTWRDRLRMTTEGLFERSVRADLGGVPARVLDPLDTVVHLGVHGALSGGDLLRWLLDVRQALSVLPCSPQELAERTVASRAVRPVWLMVERAERWLDPGLRRWRLGLPVGGGAAGAGRLWSAAFPPGAGLEGRLSGRAVYLTAALPLHVTLGRAAVAAVRRTTGPGAGQTSARPAPTGSRADYYEFVGRVGSTQGQDEKP